MVLPRTIWLLWYQGWDSAPWLQRQVLESWRIKNPGWNIILLSHENLQEYITPDYVPYIYNGTKKLSMQALSDIIRLALLSKHGGVWADSTMLCMQPLDNWVDQAVSESNGFWMYHGHGARMKMGPASWFMISEAGHKITSKWKKECDKYWSKHVTAHKYFWMDGLFKHLHNKDKRFFEAWLAVKYLYCEQMGQAHCLSEKRWKTSDDTIKQVLKEQPPYALKLWNQGDGWDATFPDRSTKQCEESNGYFAIQMALRSVEDTPKHIHTMLSKKLLTTKECVLGFFGCLLPTYKLVHGHIAIC